MGFNNVISCGKRAGSCSLSTAVSDGGKKFIIRFETDEREKFELMQRAARKIIDGNVNTGDVVSKACDEIIRYILLNESIALDCRDNNGNRLYFDGKLNGLQQIRDYIRSEIIPYIVR